MAKIRAIFWDWNGTLWDDTIIAFESMKRACAQHLSKPLTMEGFQKIFDVPITKMYENLGLQLNDTQLKDAENIFYKSYEELGQAALREGVPHLIKTCMMDQVQNFIISNHPTNKIVAALEGAKIDTYFDDIGASANPYAVVKKTMKQDRLTAIMDKEGIFPAEALIIGDSTAEIKIAKDVGLTSVALTGGYTSQERLEAEGPDYIIDNIEDIITLFSVEDHSDNFYEDDTGRLIHY